MNQNIKEDLCDIIATITPSQETIQLFSSQVINRQDAAILLDLIKSPLIFKSLSNREKPENQTLQLVHLLGTRLQDEWYELKNTYLTQIKAEIAKQHPQQSPFIRYMLFEIALYADLQDNPENWDETVNAACEERYELEQRCLNKFEDLIDNAFQLQHFSDILRCWLETILLTEAYILKDCRFEYLINSNLPMLKRELE